ncbi:MAG TPA: chromosome segregation protein SMC [Candidatus Kapabacteria bacterium]|nr:chromosome segregation protein SMC [Candidatus Kapabacteria bacterium]
MHLSEIEIFGFKSFALKTKLKFADGLSAIVGPNGCGKTNVVDAIRWVLGEKKASILRSDVMENVIFNGNKDRKPLSLAEVSISFKNNKGILPADYDELEITRRLYRSGESEYLINKSICRLKDILDLFMDTGVGPDTYSVIELKMIEQILSGKVDDRRAMFEEAAGIKKYKARRKETNRKLEIISQDMTRLNDLLLEVRKNVNSLSRQASKTKRYNQLLNELREIEIYYLSFDLQNYNNKLAIVHKELHSLNESSIKYSIELSNKSTEINEHKIQIEDIESELSELSNFEKKLLNDINDNKREKAVSLERMNSNISSIERLEKEIEESKFQINNLEQKSTIATEQLEKQKSEIRSVIEQKQLISHDAQDANSKIKDVRDKFTHANSTLNTIKVKIDSTKSNVDRNLDKERQITKKIQLNTNEVAHINSQSIRIEEEVIELNSQLEQTNIYITESEANLLSAQEQKTIIENKINDIKLNINQFKQDINSKKSTLDFLNSLVDNTEVSKFLNSDTDWLKGKEKLILGESLGVDEKFASAVVAALGEMAHSFVVDTYNEAQQAMASLKRAQKGKTGFIILEQIPKIEAQESIELNDTCFGWLSELINADDRLINVVRGLTGRTLVVSNKETANLLIANNKCDTAVTLEGELINKIGYIYGGSISQKEGQWIGKKQKIISFKENIAKIESQIAEYNEQLKDYQEEIAQIDIQNLTNLLKKYQQEAINITRKIDSSELKRESLANNITMYESMKIDLESQLSDLLQDNDKLKNQITDMYSDYETAKSNSEILKNELNQLEISNSNISKSLRDYELREVTINNSINNLISQIQSYQNQVNSHTQKIQSKEKDSNNLDVHNKELELSYNALTNTFEELEVSYNQLLNKKQLISEELKLMKENANRGEGELNELRNKLDTIHKSIHNLELNKTQFETASNNILQRLNDEFQVLPENVKLPNLEEFDANQAKNQIADIKSKLNQLGSVNFMALEEFETQSERLEFYEKQLADLISSQKILVATIEEINLNAEIKFQETFDKIRVNFKELFQKLFGADGEADLALQSENLLETDIKITAKPPNKKPHSIEMLSGGEKTLTAIALLFAIYLVKPSPFCILDEVDAPLDDKNIDKFINMIKNFSIDTQFLIVTHNKKTMEAANTLYGVTMQEDGVSKVVSVNIKQEAAA